MYPITHVDPTELYFLYNGNSEICPRSVRDQLMLWLGFMVVSLISLDIGSERSKISWRENDVCSMKDTPNQIQTTTQFGKQHKNQ
jgi:hypothetical protein